MQRPKEFDARVMAYMPGLQKLARKLTNTADEREELVQDTFAFALDRWQNFREDGGLWNWLQMNMRAILQMQRARNKTRQTYMPRASELAASMVSTPSRQEDITYANQIVRRLSRSRDGRMLVRLGGGAHLKDIAKVRGIGVERVRQLTERARERISKVAA